MICFLNSAHHSRAAVPSFSLFYLKVFLASTSLLIYSRFWLSLSIFGGSRMFVIACSNIFNTATLESLLDNCYISGIWKLIYIDCCFFNQFEIFQVLMKTSIFFLWEPGHFHIIMRILDDNQTLLLNWLCLSHLQCRKGR